MLHIIVAERGKNNYNERRNKSIDEKKSSCLYVMLRSKRCEADACIENETGAGNGGKAGAFPQLE